MNKSDFNDMTEEKFELMLVGASKKEFNNDQFDMFKKIASKIAAQFIKYKNQAIELLKDAKQVEELLIKVESKIKTVPKVGKQLAYIPQLVLLVRSYLIGEYKKLTALEIACITAALMYFVSPIDIIPDAVPVLGLLDDAVVVAVIISWCEEDLNEYMQWVKNKGEYSAR